jgi:hypothetical protein
MTQRRGTGIGRDAGTFLALAALLVAAVFLLFLVALVMPHVVGIAAVLACLLFFVAFHYVIWGWWLSATLPKEDDHADKPRWQPPVD